MTDEMKEIIELSKKYKNQQNRVMEAPEKLYFTQNENGTHYYTEWIPFEREYIEYTRTDAFIEKACDWLKNHSDYITIKGIVTYFDMGKCVEDFKKYMEQ